MAFRSLLAWKPPPTPLGERECVIRKAEVLPRGLNPYLLTPREGMALAWMKIRIEILVILAKAPGSPPVGVHLGGVHKGYPALLEGVVQLRVRLGLRVLDPPRHRSAPVAPLLPYAGLCPGLGGRGAMRETPYPTSSPPPPNIKLS